MKTSAALLVFVTLTTLCTFGTQPIASAQDLPRIAQHVYGYSWSTFAGNNAAYGVALDSSGHLIGAGHKMSSTANEDQTALLVKCDQVGNILWTAEWEEGPKDTGLQPNEHGKWSSTEIYRGVAVDEADNIYVAGEVSGVWTGYVEDSWISAMWLRRFDADGGLQWDRRYHDTVNSTWQWFSGLDLAPNGNVYVTGPSLGSWGGIEYRWTTLAYDGTGNIALGPVQHNASPDFHLADQSRDVAVLPNDGFVTVGRIGVSGAEGSATLDYDWHVRVHDSAGELHRPTTYDHGLQLEDAALAVCVVSEDMFYVVGYVNAGTDNMEGRDLDARACRYTIDGIPELNWTMGDAGGNEVFHDVEADEDGYVYMAGLEPGLDGRSQGFILKYDPLSPYPLARQTFPNVSAVYDICIRNGQIALAGTRYDDEVPDRLNFYIWVADLLGGAEGEGEGEGECDVWCEDETADTDGDGLTDCEECVTHDTDPESPDTDGDGMPDGYEVDYELLPYYNDADHDQDGDGLTNLDEFIRGTDPTDAESPGGIYYVSVAGADVPTGGGYLNPWATIGYALQQIAATSEEPARIMLLGGTFQTDVVLEPHTTLAGAQGVESSIRGTVVGAENSGLENLTLTPFAPSAGTPLLTMDDVAMRFSGVTFQGDVTRIVTGLVTSGAAVSGSVIENCVFASLARGIVIEGAIPVIRRTHFTNISNVGIQVLATPAKQNGNTLSSADDATRGWNSFDITAGARAVENNRAEELVMENTDWGVDTEVQIAALLGGTGSVDFVPFLEKGAAAAVASFYCTVWDADTQLRVLDAAVRLTPTSLRDVTENENGVYAFPAVAPGAYEVEVSAPGYPTETKAVVLPEGGRATASVPLGIGEDPPPGTCAAGVGETSNGTAGAWLVLLITGVALIAASRRRTS